MRSRLKGAAIMAEHTSNDNDVKPEAGSGGPDAHGHAAMLLVESLLHGLVARSLISIDDAIEIVEIAFDVKEEIAFELGDSVATMHKSLMLLKSIHSSLLIDRPQD